MTIKTLIKIPQVISLNSFYKWMKDMGMFLYSYRYMLIDGIFNEDNYFEMLLGHRLGHLTYSNRIVF